MALLEIQLRYRFREHWFRLRQRRRIRRAIVVGQCDRGGNALRRGQRGGGGRGGGVWGGGPPLGIRGGEGRNRPREGPVGGGGALRPWGLPGVQPGQPTAPLL